MKNFLLAILLLLLPSSLQAQNISTTTCPGAGCIDINVAGQGTIGFQVTGTWVGTITFQASVDGTNFVTILAVPSSSTTAASTTTANGAWQSVVAGYTTFRAVFTAYTSGTAVVHRRTVQAKGAGPSGSGGGSALPGGSDTQVQFNDSSVFNGDAGLTYNKTTDTLTGKHFFLFNPGPPYGGIPDDTTFYNDTTYALSGTGSDNAIASIQYAYWTLTGDGTRALISNFVDTQDTGGNGDFQNLSGYLTNSFHNSANTVEHVYGNDNFVGNSGSGNATSIYGYKSTARISSSGTVTSGYGFKSELDNQVTSAQLTKFYSFYSNDLIGEASNPYFLWYDGGVGADCNSGGVFRVNDFGILAYYNPCFAKYVPAAANFERVITRWGDTGVFGADNRAYLGVEVGGTGVDRAVNLIGANYSVTSTLTPAVTDTSANSCGTGTQTIVGNDNVGKVTIIGSAGTSCTVTFATAFTNAPSCFANNETTAALARATTTTTTAILAGTFLQNDVISYVCLGR